MSGKVTKGSVVAALMWRFLAFLAVFFVSLFACPRFSEYGDFFFFWPQVAVAYYGFTAPANDSSRTFLDGGTNFVIAGVFWVMVGLALAWFLRKRAIWVTVAAALPVSFAITWLMVLILALMNVGIYLEGP